MLDSGRFTKGMPYLLAFTWLFICLPVHADDLSYIADDELDAELEARQLDISRTQERINTLEQQLTAAQHEAQTVSQELDAIDKRLISRTSMLYRLSRNGKALRYLASSDSGTGFIKRMQTLKKLITSEMAAKRDKGLELAEAQTAIDELEMEIRHAAQMLTQLKTAKDELLAEKHRRELITIAQN